MDHMMRSIIEYMEYAVIGLKKEWESGEYKKLSDCPCYGEVKAYCERVCEKISVNTFYDN